MKHKTGEEFEVFLAVALVILAMALAGYGVKKVREDVWAERTELICLGVVTSGGGTPPILWAAYIVAVFALSGGL